MWECDVVDWPPLDEDCREWDGALVRERLGDLWMFKGATSALECLCISLGSVTKSAMVGCRESRKGLGWAGGRAPVVTR